MNIQNTKTRTWMVDENGVTVALLDHPEVRPGVVNLVHTEVDPAMGGRGLAGELTRAVAERLRAEGVRAELSCSYSVRWFAQHPEYADVLADPEAEARRAQEYGGPACGLRWG